MERLKNVYSVNLKFDNEEEIEILVFSHTHDNAIKKAKIFINRKFCKNSFSSVNARLIYENVIY